MTTTFADAVDAGHATDPARAPRVDLYASIHKALRSFMMDTLFKLGRVDVRDSAALDAALVQLQELLRLCLSHIEHEERFVHSAISARLPGGAARTAGDHTEHVQNIAELRDEAAALGSAKPSSQALLAHRLYRHLALFVADNFQHMHIEETANNAALWAHYSDAELMHIHQCILQSIAPQEHLLVARWMVPAVSAFEREMIVGAMKADAPLEAFLGVLGVIRPHLNDAEWGALARAVGVPQQPGLVDYR